VRAPQVMEPEEDRAARRDAITAARRAQAN
jgi:hypothetical protein